MKKYVSSIVVRKGFVTLLLMFIYVLGSRLTLPFVDLNNRNFWCYSLFIIFNCNGRWKSKEFVFVFNRLIPVDVFYDFVADDFSF